MSFQRVHQSRSQSPQFASSTSQFASRPFPVQKPKRPSTQEDTENEAFHQNKFEAFGLQLKEQYGTITPVEQEQLGMLQAKMDGFWVQRMERAKAQPNYLEILIRNAQTTQATEPVAPVQPKLIIGQPNDRHEQEANPVAESVVQRINTPNAARSLPIQPKLTIGAPNDKYEQAADRVAQQVVQRLSMGSGEQSANGKTPLSQPNQTLQRDKEDELQMKPLTEQIQRLELLDDDELQMKPLLQREVEPDEEDELQMKPLLQRQGSGAVAASNDLESAIQQSRGGGQPLSESIREPMEQAFGGVDFRGVKVHTDGRSDQLNRSIQAKAFTTGQDIFFRQGAYQPGNNGGQELLAHELTHVVQQNRGMVRRSHIQRRVKPTLQHAQGVVDQKKTTILQNGQVQLTTTGVETLQQHWPARWVLESKKTAVNEWNTLRTQLDNDCLTAPNLDYDTLGANIRKIVHVGNRLITAAPLALAALQPALTSLAAAGNVTPLADLILLLGETCGGVQLGVAQRDTLEQLCKAAGVAAPALVLRACGITANNAVIAAPVALFLANYTSDPKVSAVSEQVIRKVGFDTTLATQRMTAIKEYSYHESVTDEVEKLGNQKAMDEHQKAVETNRQQRESYLTNYTDTSEIDLDQADDLLALAMGDKRAMIEHTEALALIDLDTFAKKFKELTGYEHTTTFTAKQIDKPLQNQKLHAGLNAMFPSAKNPLTRDGVKKLITDKVNELEQQKIALEQGLEGNKTKHQQAVAKKLGEFAHNKQTLDDDLDPNKAKYKNALKQAITPLFAFPDSEAASNWVLSLAGADDQKATQLVTWVLNGLNAAISLPDIQKIFTSFPVAQLEQFHSPASGTDAKAQELLQLLNEAKIGEAAKFKTLIERDTLKDFKELLTLFKEANSDIDTTLGLFSKADSSKDINKLLGKLKAPTVDHLAEGTDYLKHKGTAADASFLKASNITKTDSELLLAKDWIVGQGEDVAFIYGQSGNQIVRTIAVLDILATKAKKKRTPAEVKAWLDYGHTFNNIHNKLQADENQQFWAGESCAENTVSISSRAGHNDTVDTVIATALTAKTVGQFYSGGYFGGGGNNMGGQAIGMVLPDNVNYREYDVKPYVEDNKRGKLRIVVGGSNYYYTSNHYETFKRFRT